jgi:hypothetical protein
VDDEVHAAGRTRAIRRAARSAAICAAAVSLLFGSATWPAAPATPDTSPSGEQTGANPSTPPWSPSRPPPATRTSQPVPASPHSLAVATPPAPATPAASDSSPAGQIPTAQPPTWRGVQAPLEIAPAPRPSAPAPAARPGSSGTRPGPHLAAEPVAMSSGGDLAGLLIYSGASALAAALTGLLMVARQRRRW